MRSARAHPLPKLLLWVWGKKYPHLQKCVELAWHYERWFKWLSSKVNESKKTNRNASNWGLIRINGASLKKYSIIRWQRPPTRSNFMRRRLSPKPSTSKSASMHRRTINSGRLLFPFRELIKQKMLHFYLRVRKLKNYPSQTSPSRKIFLGGSDITIYQ